MSSVTLKAIPNKIGDLALRGGSVAAGATVGAFAVEAINAQFPEQQLNVGDVTFGLGDAAVALGGSAAVIYYGQKGGDLARKIVDNAAVGAVGGWAVNKIAQAAGWNPPFQPIFPPNGNGAGFVRGRFSKSRQLYQGRITPSSAYRNIGRSRATVGGRSGTYFINRA